ncbi:LptF/LptG family permease [Devosia sp.]|uniref:LptF/LptG family permease n=1 Tax=Devosia sp. TaxID=1871048 RepID=UPI003A8E0A2B
MARLHSYLLRLFASDTAAIFGVAISLLFLGQCLRVIDATSVRGQGLWQLLWQVLLAMPPVANVLLGVCIAIGVGRTLTALHASRELHIIHGSRMLHQLTSCVLVYLLGGMLLVGALAHLVEPYTTQQVGVIKAEAAAELVGRRLVPNRFASLASDVTVSVGGRRRDGEITSFFADDRRDPETRRTYIANTAVLSRDALGYVLRLRDGTIQYRNADGSFSELAFRQYDIALERLTGAVDEGNVRKDATTPALIGRVLSGDNLSSTEMRRLGDRTSEPLYVLALGLFVAAVTLFPSGRRRRGLVPIEIAVLGAAIGARSAAALGGSAWYAPTIPPLILFTVSAIVLTVRLGAFIPRHRARQAA